jgi:hypothetical protein
MEADTKPCPVCGEVIKAVAIKCCFCNTDLGAFAAAATVRGAGSPDRRAGRGARGRRPKDIR